MGLKLICVEHFAPLMQHLWGRSGRAEAALRCWAQLMLPQSPAAGGASPSPGAEAVTAAGHLPGDPQGCLSDFSAETAEGCPQSRAAAPELCGCRIPCGHKAASQSLLDSVVQLPAPHPLTTCVPPGAAPCSQTWLNYTQAAHAQLPACRATSRWSPGATRELRGPWDGSTPS